MVPLDNNVGYALRRAYIVAWLHCNWQVATMACPLVLNHIQSSSDQWCKSRGFKTVVHKQMCDATWLKQRWGFCCPVVDIWVAWCHTKQKQTSIKDESELCCNIWTFPGPMWWVQLMPPPQERWLNAHWSRVVWAFWPQLVTAEMALKHMRGFWRHTDTQKGYTIHGMYDKEVTSQSVGCGIQLGEESNNPLKSPSQGSLLI